MIYQIKKLIDYKIYITFPIYEREGKFLIGFNSGSAAGWYCKNTYRNGCYAFLEFDWPTHEEIKKGLENE